jgi:hypothetical protein
MLLRKPLPESLMKAESEIADAGDASDSEVCWITFVF